MLPSADCAVGDGGQDPHRQQDDEGLDPRVQTELEKLNARTEEINALEVQLEDANGLFRTLLTDSTAQLKTLSKKLGSCIEKARPYYEALQISQVAQKECQSAATHYQRASGVHAAAKETIALAEQRFLSNSNEWNFDNAWQEMLNHATIKVMEAEKIKTESESEHLRRADAYQQAEAEVQRLEKKLHKFIVKSAPYFEQKDVFNKALEGQKARVQELQAKIIVCKKQYAQSLRNLEDISESIHAQRRLRERPREPGVGAELAQLPDFDLDVCDGASSSEAMSLGGCSSSLSSVNITKSMDGDGASQREADLYEATTEEMQRMSLRSGICMDQMPSIEPVPSPPRSPVLAPSRLLKSISRSLSVPTQMLFRQQEAEEAAAAAAENKGGEEDNSVQGLTGDGAVRL